MDIFILDLNKFDLSLLNPSLATKSYKDEFKQKQHLAGMYLVAHVANVYNIQNAKLIYENGKPYFENKEYFFSISHSKNLVAIAVNKNDIGLDIENNEKERNFLAILNKFDKKFAQNLKGETKDVIKKSFYEFWTKYEARIKLGVQKQIIYKTLNISENFTLSVASLSKIEDLNIYYL